MIVLLTICTDRTLCLQRLQLKLAQRVVRTTLAALYGVTIGYPAMLEAGAELVAICKGRRAQ